MGKTPVSRRGVYRDLSLSPYEYESPYGDLFKFPSQKKLEIYARDVENEIAKINKALDRLEMREHLPYEIVMMLHRLVYRGFYRKVVR